MARKIKLLVFQMPNVPRLCLRWQFANPNVCNVKNPNLSTGANNNATPEARMQAQKSEHKSQGISDGQKIDSNG